VSTAEKVTENVKTAAVGFDHVFKAFVARGRRSEPVLALQDVAFDGRASS
jgi:NitT/TauT family transport system ATP-binding protein